MIEDNDANFELVAATLGTYTLQRAVSGEEGLQLANQAVPDLNLTYIRLPGIDVC